MKATKMRIKGELLGGERMFEVIEALKRGFKRAGFITGIEVKNSSSIKIGLHMCSFRIDRTKHDRNLRHNPHTGTKLTDIPTWEQRVEFNNIVNRVFNRFKVSAKVISGPFTIRDGLRAMTEDNWIDQKPSWITHNECCGYYIEACDEREYLEERRLERNRVAREKRAAAKQRALNIAAALKHAPDTEQTELRLI